MPLTKSDQSFIALVLRDELEPGMMEELDKRMVNPEFKQAFEVALDAKYAAKKGLIRGYLPMIILMILLIVGLYLIISR